LGLRRKGGVVIFASFYVFAFTTIPYGLVQGSRVSKRCRLKPEFWHKGFAAEAAESCKNFAFEKIGFKEIFSKIAETNTASVRVAERIGMTLLKSYQDPKSNETILVYRAQKTV